MAFILRRPFAVANVVKQAPRASQITSKSFQTHATKQAFAKPTTPIQAFAKRQNAFLNSFRQTAKRKYQTAAPRNPVGQGNLTQRLIYGGKMSTPANRWGT